MHRARTEDRANDGARRAIARRAGANVKLRLPLLPPNARGKGPNAVWRASGVSLRTQADSCAALEPH